MSEDTILAGTMLSELSAACLPIIFKNSGLDFFIIDCEHGGFDWAPLSALLMNARLCGLTSIVRLPDNQRRDITRLMDMGAGGLLLPMTNCVGDIEQVIRYAKYAPIGQRGISTTRAHTLYNPPVLAEYMPAANARTQIFAQIETAAGLRAIDDICHIDGLSGALVGPNDLSCDLNCIGNDAPILDALVKVAKSAQEHGVLSGVITGNDNYLRKASECRMDMMCIGSELNMLKSGASAIVARVSQGTCIQGLQKTVQKPL